MTLEDVRHLQSLSERQRWRDLLQSVEQLLHSAPKPDADWTRILFTFRGAANMGLNRYTDASSDFSRAIELGSTGAAARYSRAVCLLVLSNSVNGAEQVLLLRRCLIDLDEALVHEPNHSLSMDLRKKIEPLVQDVPGPSVKKADYWDIAKKVADIVGTLVGSALK